MYFPQIAKIIDIKIETAEAKTFKLEFPSGHLEYLPGQYLTLNESLSRPELSRNYSITSIPEESMVSITIKRQANGYFSRKMIDHAKVGDEIHVIGVFGQFILPPLESEYDYLFFAAGSGIAPIYSLIKSLLNKNTFNNIDLYYSSRSPQETIFYHELEILQSQYPSKFKVQYFFSQTNQIDRARISAFMIPSILKEKKLSHTFSYLCGPIDYMDTIRMSLQTYGLKSNHIFTEEFSYLSDDESTLIPPPDKTERNVTIHLNQQTKEFSVKYPETILQSALKNNVMLPYSCSSGQCGSCTARIIKGKVWLMFNEVLTEKELEDGKTLTCMGCPIDGDVELSYQ